MVGKILAESLIVAEHIAAEAIEPIFALVVGHLKGYDAKGVDVAHLVDVNGAVDAGTHIGIVANDVGHLEACRIETL